VCVKRGAFGKVWPLFGGFLNPGGKGPRGFFEKGGVKVFLLALGGFSRWLPAFNGGL